MNLSLEEELAWTVYEPGIFECIDARTGKSKTSKGLMDCIILELYEHRTGRRSICFFNTIKNRSGNFSVKKGSKFAKLYRVTTGKDPGPRLSKAQQLAKHLVGYKFLCEFRESISSQGSVYLNVTKIEPLNPCQSDKWLPDGTPRKKVRKPTSGVAEADASSNKSQEQSSIKIEKERQNNGNNLDIPDLSNPCIPRAEEQKSVHKQIQLHSIAASTHDHSLECSGIAIKEKYISGVRHRDINFQQKPDENYQDYIERVIEASLII